MFLEAKEWQFGRQNVFAVTVGVTDLPTGGNLNGLIQPGDMAINLSGTVGQPAIWQVSAASSTSVTWSVVDVLGAANAARTSAGSTTLLASDHYLFMTAAGTVTIPVASTTFGVHSFEVKAVAQPVTLTAVTSNFDNVAAGSQTLTGNESASLFCDGTAWWTVGRDPLQQVRTASPPATLSLTDKFVICPAGALTLQASTLAPIGAEVIVHGTGSVTVTPASGSINGAAALTIAANATSRIWTDGTQNWYA